MEPHDPPRWTDPEGDAPDGIGDLLREARGDVPDPSRAAQVAARAQAAHAGAGAGALSPLQLVLGGAALTAAVVVGAIWVTEPGHPTPSASAPPAPRARADVPGASREVGDDTASPAVPAEAPSPPRPREAIVSPEPAPSGAIEPPDDIGATAPPPSRADAVETPPAGALSQRRAAGASPAARRAEPPAGRSVGESEPQLDESALLDRARAQLASDPAAALAATARHARHFPRGLLVEEREVIAVDALMRLGRSETARARARRFTLAHPRSVYRARVEALVR